MADPQQQAITLPRVAGQKRSAPEREGSSSQEQSGVEHAKKQKTAPSTTPDTSVEEKKPEDFVERSRYLLNIDINPAFIDRLKASNVLGYAPVPGKRKLKTVHIELDVTEWQKSIEDVTQKFLKRVFLEQNRLSDKEITAEVDNMVPLIVDATMNAVYSRLRVIHKLHGEHAARFNAPPSYSKEIELPLPLANAVQELGPFEVTNVKEKIILCPVYPANTLNEGRKNQTFSAFDYVGYTSVLKELRIPLKSVITQSRSGSAWWTYKVVLNNKKFDLQCTIPPIHYSHHSAILRGVFLRDPCDTIEHQLIKEDILTCNYGTMLRECGTGYNVRAMHALCHTRDEDWNRDMD